MRHRVQSAAVIGLGFVGLPLAAAFASNGIKVVGIDIDAQKISQLQQGQSYLADVPDELLAELSRNKMFSASYEFERVKEAEAIIICVPTPLKNHEPDLSYVLSSVEFILPYLTKGQLIVLESSTYPGTTEDFIATRLRDKGYTIGTDLFLGYSPERIDPGNPSLKLLEIPKIISGMTAACLERVKDLYDGVFQKTVPVSSPLVAEFVKLFENSQRMINISFINEINMLAHKLNIDLWEAIEAAKTKPVGFHAYYPSVGIGGHCIPVDPYYLTWIGMQEGVPLSMIHQAGLVNESMPHHIVSQVQKLLPEEEGSRKPAIGIIGLTYKKDVNDIRESASLKAVELLKQKRIDVYVHDDVYQGPLPSGVRGFAIDKNEMRKLDVTLILVDHSYIDWDKVTAFSRRVVDTKNVTRHIHDSKIIRL